MIHEKNKRDLRLILTIKIDISYGMSFLTEFSIAPKLQMDSIFPSKRKINVAKLTKTSSDEFGLVPNCRSLTIDTLRALSLLPKSSGF